MSDHVQLVDISHWQGIDIDFTVMGQNAAGVFIKASQAYHEDQMFRKNWVASKGKLLRGAYHYLDWSKPARDQAKFFGGLITSVGHGELPCVVDFECRAKVPSGKTSVAVQDFLETLQSITGLVPMIYTNPSYWREFGTPAPKWLKYPLWIANYGVLKPSPIAPWGTEYDVWQYSDKGDGKKYGLKRGAIDLDKFNGNMEAFLLWSKVMTGISIGDVPPPDVKICQCCKQPILNA